METSPFGKAASRMLASPTSPSNDEAMPQQTNAHKAGHTPARGEPSPAHKKGRAGGAEQTAEDLEAGPSRPVTREDPLSPERMGGMKDALEDDADDAKAPAVEEDCLTALLNATSPSAGPSVLQAPPRALSESLAAATGGTERTASGEAPSGWLVDAATVQSQVADAKAQAAADHDALLEGLRAAVGRCGDLEKIPPAEVKKKDITRATGGVISYDSLFDKAKEKTSVKKAQFRVRGKLEDTKREAREKRRLALAEAELNTLLRLELEARAVLEAASAGASREARLKSMRACAKLMDEADDDILSAEPDGNLGTLVAEMRKAQVALITQVDGVYEKKDKGALPNLIVRSLDAVLTKRPPEEVVQTALRSIAAEKLAPQGNKEASEALEADVNSACGAFPQKTNLVLGPMPSIDGAEGERLRRAHDRRTDAPASQLASVHFCMPFDSASLGGVTDPSRLPVWDDQPRVMVNARTVKTIDSMQEHADFLLKAKRVAEGKARAARNRQSCAPEEGSSSAAESSSAEEDESKEDESL